MIYYIYFVLIFATSGETLSVDARHGRQHTHKINQSLVHLSGHDSLTSTNQSSRRNTGSINKNEVSGSELETKTRQYYDYSSGSDRSMISDMGEALQDQPNQPQNVNTAAAYEKELRRRIDLRRRHEEERRRRIEERRRLDEKSRQEIIRKRLEERRYPRQREQQERVNEQQSQTTVGHSDLRSHVTRSDNMDNSRRQQQPSFTSRSQQPLVPSKTTNTETVPKTGTQYQHGYRHATVDQQFVDNDSSRSSYQPDHRSNVGQRPVSGTDREQGHQIISNYRSETIDLQPPDVILNGRHEIPNQQSSRIASTQSPDLAQSYYGQSGQVDPRLPLTSYTDNHPGFRRHHTIESQRQGQWYPYQSAGANLGSYHDYNEPRMFSNCPDTGIELRINGLSCELAVQQLGACVCYTHEYTSRLCCETCIPLKKPSRIGCEYGDHSQQCSSISASDCYDVKNRQTCCETCEKLRRINAPLGCEYGDRAISCETVRQTPGLCYRPDNQRICCETCSQARNVSNHGCPWGDFSHNVCQVSDVHTNNIRINCYSLRKRQLCCQACEKLREQLPGNLSEDCKYGDRPVIFNTSHFGQLNCSNILNYFSSDECYTNPAVYTNCCYTCHRYLNSQG